MPMTNKPPVRPASREPIYDVIDGECEHLAEVLPDATSITELYALLGVRIRRAREAHVEGDPTALVVAQNNLREIAGLAVRAMDVHGTLPREYRVPPSANITGTLNVSDLTDKL